MNYCAGSLTSTLVLSARSHGLVFCFESLLFSASSFSDIVGVEPGVIVDVELQALPLFNVSLPPSALVTSPTWPFLVKKKGRRGSSHVQA